MADPAADPTATAAPLALIEPVQEFLWIVIVGGIVSVVMSYGVGANDVANAFATSVGAKAISIKQAVLIAAIFEFAGAVGLGASVSDTIRGGITNNEVWEGEGDIFMLGQFCSLFSAAAWLILATKYQLPVSTTQSIVGALIGFVLVSKGPDSVDWNAVWLIIVFWVVTPLCAATGSIIFFFPTRQFLFRREDSYEQSIRFWPFFVFVVFFIMSLFLLLESVSTAGHVDFTSGQSVGIAAACGVVVAIIAWGVLIKTGLVEKFVDKMVAPQEDRGTKIRTSVKVGTDHEFEMVSNGKDEATDDDERVDDEKQANHGITSPLARLRTSSSSKDHDNGVVAGPPLEPAVNSGGSASNRKSPSASRSSLR